MLTLLAAAALAADPQPADAPGTLHVDAKVPAEILIDGVKLAQLWYAGQASFEVVPGRHQLRVYTSGQPTDFPLDIQPGQGTWVVVGRTGISLDSLAGEQAATLVPAEDALVPVEFRSLGGGAQLRVDDQRLLLGSGQRLDVELDAGDHALSVRSADGTVVWATGTLEVDRGDRLVVQIAEGRLPEISGAGRFHAGGR
jgi:hypothetical protein